MMKTTVVHGKKLFMTWLRYAGSMCRRHGPKSFHATGARILSDDLNEMKKISVAERFGITKKEAEDIACDIRKTVADRWRDLAKSCGLSRGQIEAMAPAFMTYIKGQT